MHIAIAGPIATADLADLLRDSTAALPRGYEGAPLLVTLIRELLALGHRVTAVTLSSDISGSVNSRSREYNLEVFYCPMRRHAWRPNGRRAGRIVDLYAYERASLERVLRDARPDVVHAHWAYEFSLATLATGVPHVVTCHDSPYAVARHYSKDFPTRSFYRWLRVLMARRVLREAKMVTTVSPYLRDAIKPLTRSPIRIVPNPVDKLAIELGRDRSISFAPKIAMVCNGWSELKNPQPAMRAFYHLRSMCPGATLHLYGHDFGAGETAERWARKNGIETGMLFCGSLPHSALLKSLADVDILLHPALEESFGMSIAEALAMGVPVVAGKSSGAVPWVIGDGGILCDVRSTESLHDALARVLDPTCYARLSKLGRRRVAHSFTPNAVIAGYLDLYSSVTEETVCSEDHVRHGGAVQ